MQRYRSGIVLWIADTIWGFVLPGLVLMTGLSARMRDWSTRIGRKWFFIIAIYFAVFSILTFVIDLPRAYYEEFVRDHAYGLSNQTFQKWFSDSLISLVVGIIGGTLFLWIPYLLLRKSPRRWWLYTGLAAVPFLLLMIVVKPVWIDPLFNTFGPMKDKALETRILQLADRAGIAGSRVYEVDKSTDTNALNAYVTGFGATKRIVLWDTIIKRLDEPQLLFVMGHEMGHYVLGHMWKLVAMFAIVILLTLFGIHLTAGAVIARYRGRIGFESLGDIASLPLLLLLFNLGFLIASPFALAYNRHVEHEADRFGLEITRTNHVAATVLRPAAAGQPRQPESGLADQGVRVQPSHAWRANRVRQHVPSVGARRAARLRVAFQMSGWHRRPVAVALSLLVLVGLAGRRRDVVAASAAVAGSSAPHRLSPRPAVHAVGPGRTSRGALGRSHFGGGATDPFAARVGLHERARGRAVP